MLRPIIFFLISSVLSVITLYGKAEHTFDFALVAPTGLYFIVAYLVAFQPKVKAVAYLQFIGLSWLLWLVLFMASYNLFFFVAVPLAGGLGSWLFARLADHFLGMKIGKVWPVIWTGVIAGVLGLVFMVVVKGLPKDVYTIGLKCGMIVAFWQLGVGVQLWRLRVD